MKKIFTYSVFCILLSAFVPINANGQSKKKAQGPEIITNSEAPQKTYYSSDSTYIITRVSETVIYPTAILVSKTLSGGDLKEPVIEYSSEDTIEKDMDLDLNNTNNKESSPQEKKNEINGIPTVVLGPPQPNLNYSQEKSKE
jgi:hypothetical protein